MLVATLALARLLNRESASAAMILATAIAAAFCIRYVGLVLLAWVFIAITIFAVANTGLVNYVTASRLLYGMASWSTVAVVLGRHVLKVRRQLAVVDPAHRQAVRDHRPDRILEHELHRLEVRRPRRGRFRSRREGRSSDVSRMSAAYSP